MDASMVTVWDGYDFTFMPEDEAIMKQDSGRVQIVSVNVSADQLLTKAALKARYHAKIVAKTRQRDAAVKSGTYKTTRMKAE